ncbi:MAG: ankyrin repeat domain-containing protein, partial [Pseudomonadota bacterium]
MFNKLNLSFCAYRLLWGCLFALVLGWTTTTMAASEDVDALVSASVGGDYKKVQALLKKGVDANTMGTGGVTALMEAALGGHRDVAELLLAHGADANTMNSDGATALMAATMNGHLEVVKLLLGKGADVNTKSPS